MTDPHRKNESKYKYLALLMKGVLFLFVLLLIIPPKICQLGLYSPVPSVFGNKLKVWEGDSSCSRTPISHKLSAVPNPDPSILSLTH